MKPGPEYLGHAGRQLARGRLAQYVRYAELVSEQEAALEGDDLERFDELADEVTKLRAEIGPAPSFDGAADPSESRDAARVLHEALASNQRIQDRLVALRRDHAGRIRSVRERTPQARTYVEEPDGTTRTRLDVTL